MNVPIFLTKEKVALVSREDYPKLAPFKWQAQYNSHSGKWYACRFAQRKKIYMHREITGCPSGFVVDHKNGDGLANWRGNLRVVTAAFNAANCRAYGLVPYRGVTFYRGKYRARINDAYLGSFDTAEEAARAYDRAAREAWGEYAWINLPASFDPIATPYQEIPF